MKVYFAQEKSRKYEEISFSFFYKGCVFRIFTFIHRSHKRLNRLSCVLRNKDIFCFTLDIWASDDPSNLGKEIEVTTDLTKLLVSEIKLGRDGFYTLKHAELIEEWRQENTMTM